MNSNIILNEWKMDDNMKKANNLINQLILFFIGMSIIQFGVALFLKTNIGSDPFTVFTQGLASMLNKTSLKDFSLVKLISGGTIGVGTVIAMILIGPFIQFALPYGEKFVAFIVNENEEENYQEVVQA